MTISFTVETQVALRELLGDLPVTDMFMTDAERALGAYYAVRTANER